MIECKKCGRPLEHGEKGLCPSCVSNKSRKKKFWVEVGAGCLFVVGLVGAIIFKGGDDV